MNQITKLRKASNDFVRNMDLYKSLAVKESEAQLVLINQLQMLRHKTADDSIIKPKYSPNYAKRKGFRDPNLFVSGEFQDKMFLKVKIKQFTLDSKDFKTRFLTNRYGVRIFGIPPSQNNLAQKTTTIKLGEIYLKLIKMYK